MSVRARAVLSVGSNLGDRLGTLQGCVQAIGRLPDTDVLAISPVYQTAPVGGPPQPDYLNAVLLVATAQSPRDLLHATQRIEAAYGRVRAERFGPRTLDVDIISYAAPASAAPASADPASAAPASAAPASDGQIGGGQISDDPVLTLPHPRAHERAFVLVPWHDLAPAAELPGRGPIAALMAGLDRSGVHLVPGAVLRLPRPPEQPS